MLAGERPDVEVVEHPGHRHADFIKDLPEQARMVHKVALLADRADAEPEVEPATGLLRANGPLHQQQQHHRGAAGRPVRGSKARSHVRSDSASSYEPSMRLAGAGAGPRPAEWKKGAA